MEGQFLLLTFIFTLNNAKKTLQALDEEEV